MSVQTQHACMHAHTPVFWLIDSLTYEKAELFLPAQLQTQRSVTTGLSSPAPVPSFSTATRFKMLQWHSCSIICFLFLIVVTNWGALCPRLFLLMSRGGHLHSLVHIPLAFSASNLAVLSPTPPLSFSPSLSLSLTLSLCLCPSAFQINNNFKII